MDLFGQSGLRHGESDNDSWYPRRENDIDAMIRQKNEEIQKLKHELKEEIESRKKETNALKKKIKELEEEIRMLKGNKNVLIIGQVCRVFQANLYQVVFPEKKASKYYSYKIADLETDIKKIKSSQKKDESRKLWEDLKQKEHPERFQELVEKLQKMRNDVAHPEITGEVKLEDVLKAAEELDQQGEFEFLDPDFEFKDIKELVELWGRTEHYVKGLKK